ncbi:MAG: hypothetical protein ACLTDX_02220 [[Clostridium] innocuum]
MEQPSSFFGEDMHRSSWMFCMRFDRWNSWVEDSVVLGQYFQYQKEDACGG